MEVIKKTLIKNMKALRNKKGWNQDKLAEECGYSRGFITDIERGKSWVSPEALDKICDALGVTCDKLFSIDEGQGKMFDMPMNKAIKKLLAIPDEVYEKAQKVPLDDQAWVAVIAALEVAAERIASENGNHSNHS
jgi:transcriptional regulator with XRE-family HTH domain